jgi:glycogen operon protein
MAPGIPSRADRFDAAKVVLDPYARAIVGEDSYSSPRRHWPRGVTCATALKAVVADNSYLRLGGGSAPSYSLRRHASSTKCMRGGLPATPPPAYPPMNGAPLRGSIDAIPCLGGAGGDLAVELMPVHQFDPQDVQPGLENYWGYSTLNFSPPHRAYSSRRGPLGPINEFATW